MTGGQLASWIGLSQLAVKTNKNWTLIGGQLIQLHCWERNVSPSRVTDDIDAVLDVIMQPEILLATTKILKDLGFTPAGITPSGHQYKWVRDGSEIDLLFPDHIGPRAIKKTGITGGTTLETPGGREVFFYNELVRLKLNGNTFEINRPNLWGAFYIKSRAFLNSNDPGKKRHLEDLANLLALIRVSDAQTPFGKDFPKYVNTALAKLKEDRFYLNQVNGALVGLQQLEAMLQ